MLPNWFHKNLFLKFEQFDKIWEISFLWNQFWPTNYLVNLIALESNCNYCILYRSDSEYYTYVCWKMTHNDLICIENVRKLEKKMSSTFLLKKSGWIRSNKKCRMHWICLFMCTQIGFRGFSDFWCCSSETWFSESWFREILDLMNKLLFLFSHFTLYPESRPCLVNKLNLVNKRDLTTTFIKSSLGCTI